MITVESQLRPLSPPLTRWVTFFSFLLLYVPLISLVIYSFLGPSGAPGSPNEWTLHWYRKLASNRQVLDALTMSLFVGAWSTLGATLLGTTAALALAKTQFPGRRIFEAFIYIPLIIPEIVLGLSLLIWFVLLRISLGSFSIVLAHITFSTSYVIVTVKSRLHDFDESLKEAARDLGANAWQTFWKVTLPLIWPGVLSGALMAFTLSFDDFLITFFTAGVGSDTLPLKIYSMIKFGVTPEINALSSIILGLTLLFVFLFMRRSQPTQ